MPLAAALELEEEELEEPPAGAGRPPTMFTLVGDGRRKPCFTSLSLVSLSVNPLRTQAVEHEFLVVENLGVPLLLSWDFVMQHDVLVSPHQGKVRAARLSWHTPLISKDEHLKVEYQTDGPMELAPRQASVVNISPAPGQPRPALPATVRWTCDDEHLEVEPEPVVQHEERAVLRVTNISDAYREGTLYFTATLVDTSSARRPSLTDLVPPHADAHLDIEKEIRDKRWPHLTDVEQHQLRQPLMEFKDPFATDPKAPTMSSVLEHRIPTGDHPPVRARGRRLNPLEVQVLRTGLQPLIDSGILVPSTSAWSAPVLLVRKKDNTLRAVVDYRQLNARTLLVDPTEIPSPEQAFDSLGGSSFWSVMDLASGFWQLPVAPEDRHKPAISTPFGTWEWTRMPMGFVVGATATFQHAMVKVMHDLLGVCLVQYAVHSPDFPSHLNHLRQYMERLRDANMQLKWSKAQFAATSVRFLGHVVDRHGLRTDPDKVRAVAEPPAPRAVPELRSQLGLLSYFRRHIREFALLAAPLHALLRKDTPFVWSEMEEAAWRGLTMKSRRLLSAPVLALPRWHLPFVIHCDASARGVGVGAVLLQEEDGVERPVAYASKMMTEAEKKYPVFEQEGLAVVFAIRSFNHYVRNGLEVMIVTDHKALLAWQQKPILPGRLQRWLAHLQDIPHRIVHPAGTSHGDADALSRHPLATPTRPTTDLVLTLQADHAPDAAS